MSLWAKFTSNTESFIKNTCELAPIIETNKTLVKYFHSFEEISKHVFFLRKTLEVFKIMKHVYISSNSNDEEYQKKNILCRSIAYEYNAPQYITNRCECNNKTCRITIPSRLFFLRTFDSLYAIAVFSYIGNDLTHTKSLYAVLSIPDFIRNYIQLFTSLQIMHDNGISHNDIHTGNILLDNKTNDMWITDFDQIGEANTISKNWDVYRLVQTLVNAMLPELENISMDYAFETDENILLIESEKMLQQYETDNKIEQGDSTMCEFARMIAALYVVFTLPPNTAQHYFSAEDMLHFKSATLSKFKINQSFFNKPYQRLCETGF